MLHASIYKGIVFIEGYEPTATRLGKVEYHKLFSFNAQIQTLDAVKEQLFHQTVQRGGNAVINFTYGQKSSGWFKSSLFSLDDNIKWYGSGEAARIPEDRLKEIVASFV